MAFDPSAFHTFRFTGADFDENTLTARLSYALDDQYRFTEEFRFPGGTPPASPSARDALAAALQLLHLAAGISYYKTALPAEVRVESAALPPATAVFFSKLYRRGLGEFAYRNRLRLDGKGEFPVHSGTVPTTLRHTFTRRTAVPLGGGKDSVVTLEALKQAGEPLLAISVGGHRPIRRVAERGQVPLTVIERRVDPLLFELNRAGAYNGHVPISAIVVFALIAGAVLYGYDTIAISQERSANAANVTDGLESVNHQYSKSAEFEHDLAALLETVLPGIEYFSFLRPLSELGICERFARRCPGYLDVFTSCNAAFRIDAPPNEGWCCGCPKCRFVFLALAPFVARERLITVFGRNLFNEEAQIPGFAELLGLEGHKPFECVGEIEESQAALALTAEQSAWQQDAVIRHFIGRVSGQLPSWRSQADAALASAHEHRLPHRFLEALNAF